MSLTVGSYLGAYEIVALLGAGGMGQVYRARDARLDRDVAIKVLPAALASDPVARERLRREAIAAARIDHPFICKIFDIGETDGLLFLVMELVNGETLSARLEAGPVSGPTMVAWALEMAEALDTAHARRIVHRDLKPANVMVTEQGHIKVMDFGLAKDVSAADSDPGAAVTVAAPLTHRFVRVGTPGYMAPEQIVGGVVDARTDIFALGVLLAEAATGVHPFRRPTLPATTTAVMSEAPVFGASIATLPMGLPSVLFRMLAKSPEARYQSMTELRGDLIALASTAMPTSELGGTRWAAADRIGQVRRWPLVARDAERAELREQLTRAVAGHGRMVLIGGEPGVGKTRLTEALLEDARDRGCMSLVGHAYETEGAAPFLPFIEMLEYSSRVVPPAALRRAIGDAAPEIARLMPELRQMFPDIPPALDISAEQQRRMLFNGYRDFVVRSAALAPIVAVLEDLHWADDSTLQLLLHVAPVIASLPMLVVITYRDVELDVHRPFAKALETLVRQRFAARMPLKRLSADGVRAMLAAMSGVGDPPPSLAQIVYAETEGNPFFVEEVFQHLKEEDRLFDANGAWRASMRVETFEVPEGVRLVIGRRLERLSDQARRVLATAAVIGRSFSLTLLEDLEGDARITSDAVLDSVEEAERAHLVAAQQSGRETRYLFTHELIRQTLAESLSIPRRQRLHAKIAAAIERVYASTVDRHVAAIAHHLFQAGTASDPDKTTAYLVRAAEEARTTSAPEDALRCLDQALSVWDAPPAHVLADLHDRRGRILRMLGRADEAIDALSRASDAWDADRDVDRLVNTAAELVITHLWQVNTSAALRVASSTLDRVRSAPPVRQFPIEMLNIVALAVAGETETALTRLRGVEDARAWAGIRPLEFLLRVLECHVRWTACELADARGRARRVVETYTAPEELWLVADVGWIAPFVDFYLGDPVSDDEIARAESLAEQIGQGAPLGLLRMLRTFLLAERGDLAGAERAVRQNAEFNRAVGNRWGFFSTQFAAMLATLQGRFDDARAYIAEAVRNEPESYYRRHSAATQFWILAHCAPDAAAAHWHTLGISPPDVHAINPLGAWANIWPAVLGLAILGRRDEAATFSRAAAAVVSKGIVWAPGSAVGVCAETVAAVAAGCAREWDAAEAFFERAVARADRTPGHPESSNARIWWADMLRHRDRPGDRARVALLCDEAAARAAAIGALLYERQARGIQARL